MQKIIKLWKYLRCRYCGRDVSSVGAGTNMGTEDRPMCERCYERGGDDE